MRPWPAVLLLAGACSGEGDADDVRAEPVAPAERRTPELAPSHYRFVDVTRESGLSAFHQVCGDAEKPFILETVGAGVALVDVDRDGDLDAYLSNGSFLGATAETAPRDALWLNDGSGRFHDVTEAAGLGDRNWTCGVRVADFDADGWPDLYLTNWGPNVLYRNRGDGTFEDVTRRTGTGDPGWSTGACFLDFDQDGDLDLYVSNYLEFDAETMQRERPMVSYKGVEVMKGPIGLTESLDTLYVNEGGVFRDASAELGIHAARHFSFQCVAFDADRDGWVDVYVANDSVENVLWHNLEGKGFEDRAFLGGLAFSVSGKPQAGMGVALADFDGDLLVDVYVTNFADDYFTLYRGTERNFYVDATHRLRLAEATKPFLGWGCGFDDFDADGDLELHVANGHVYPQVDRFEFTSGYRQENLLFEFDGVAFRRVDGGPGFALLQSSRGSAVGDIDGDGDLDLLFGNLDDAPTLLRNDTPGGNRLEILLVGAGGNRDAVGARVVVTVGERKHLRLPSTASGFLSSSAPELFVGLGDATKADLVEVRWPGGARETFADVPAGVSMRIEEGRGPQGSSLVEFRRR